MAFIAIMAGAGYYVFNQAVAGGEYVTVPNIVNLPIIEASYKLAENGLEIGKQTPMHSDQVPKYHVIAQRPAAGKVVRANRRVYPVVSSGQDYVEAPSLVNMTIAEARKAIAQSAFREGSLARMPHHAPRDTVIAQNPPQKQNILRGGEIHLLVSDGVSSRPVLMPKLINLPLQEVADVLAPMGVVAVANRVDTPGRPFDVVLDQRPPSGTLVHPGQTITYDVRLSGIYQVPNMRRKIEVAFVVPRAWALHEVRVDVVDINGRATVLPKQREYDNGVRIICRPGSQVQPGSTIKLQRTFMGTLTVEFYLDDKLAKSYYYEDDAEPVITDYDVGLGGTPNA